MKKHIAQYAVMVGDAFNMVRTFGLGRHSWELPHLVFPWVYVFLREVWILQWIVFVKIALRIRKRQFSYPESKTPEALDYNCKVQVDSNYSSDNWESRFVWLHCWLFTRHWRMNRVRTMEYSWFIVIVLELAFDLVERVVGVILELWSRKTLKSLECHYYIKRLPWRDD